MVFLFFDVWTTEDGSVSPCDFSLPTIYSAFYCLVQCTITAFSDSADSGHVQVSGVVPPPTHNVGGHRWPFFAMSVRPEVGTSATNVSVGEVSGTIYSAVSGDNPGVSNKVLEMAIVCSKI